MNETQEREDVARNEDVNEVPAGGVIEQESRAMERGEKRVPVSEAIRYRKRAQEAETKSQELETALEELRGALDESRASLIAAERRRNVDEVLVELRAVDLETARVLLDRSVDEEEETDIRRAALELKRRKPFLFRSVSGTHGSAMGGRPRQARDGLEKHAAVAAESGDRGALMRYLRVRRKDGSA